MLTEFGTRDLSCDFRFLRLRTLVDAPLVAMLSVFVDSEEDVALALRSFDPDATYYDTAPKVVELDAARGLRRSMVFEVAGGIRPGPLPPARRRVHGADVVLGLGRCRSCAPSPRDWPTSTGWPRRSGWSTARGRAGGAFSGRSRRPRPGSCSSTPSSPARSPASPTCGSTTTRRVWVRMPTTGQDRTIVGRAGAGGVRRGPRLGPGSPEHAKVEAAANTIADTGLSYTASFVTFPPGPTDFALAHVHVLRRRS